MKCPKCGAESTSIKIAGKTIPPVVCNSCGEVTRKDLISGKVQEPALICNAFAPIFIQKETAYTIGREDGNDIVLKSKLVSRLHTIIKTDAQRNAFVEDQGSRNGTQINNTRILKKTSLKIGDKISIGSHNLFFKNISKQEANTTLQLSEGSTLPVSTLRFTEGLLGSISTHITIEELFTTIEGNQKTGVLTVSANGLKGKAYFSEGEIIYSEYGELLHLKAAFALLQLREGVFEFVSQEVSNISREIALPTMQILLEYSKTLDENHKN